MLTIASYVLATVALLFIAAGLFFASDRWRHIPLMLEAFAADMIGLVLVEVVIPLQTESTDPVSGLFETDGNWAWRVVHASLATLAVVGYVIQIISGRKLARGDRGVLGFHRRIARGFVVTRVLAYVTMFFV